jgi:phenylalanyl-tRNA synthetase alpha chain
MSETLDKTQKTFQGLGVTRPEQVLQLFSELRSLFDASALAAASTKNVGRLPELQSAWNNDSSGVIRRIHANWVTLAPPNLRGTTERAMKHLSAHVGVGVKAVQTLQQLGVHDNSQVVSLFSLLRDTFDQDIQLDIDEIDVEITRINWLGRKTGILAWARDHWMKSAPDELRREVGRCFNEIKAHIEQAINDKRASARPAILAAPLYQDQSEYRPAIRPTYAQTSGNVLVDVSNEQAILPPDPTLIPEDLSLPGVIRPIGSHHLIRQVFQEIENIFVSIGFSVVEGPEIETPYYNFEALNIPEFHPVRDDMDTFYLELPKGAPTPLLLRTHTSPMQIRTMEKQKPPVRVIVPGKVYRRDNPDATHSFAFHQIEGLAVDSDITFCDFTGTIEYFVKQFFGPSVKTRFRPSYFPFTEPSVEFDVSCPFCGGTGTAAGGGTCSKCKGAAWIELFGAGMVDPAVYGFVNYDAKKVSGFAFGIGIDRLAMLKYGIDDIQVFFQNDVRFLRQFP